MKCGEYVRGKGGTLLVAGDELDILDTIGLGIQVSSGLFKTDKMKTYAGQADGADDLALVKGPEAQSLGTLDASSGLENAQRDDVVRGEDEVVLEVNTQPVRAELLTENVELSRYQHD